MPSEEPLTIVVAGAGAVGSTLGGFLAARGHRVTLVGRDPHMATVARDGLRVTGIFVPAHSRPDARTDLSSADAPCDLALVTVKSHATATIGESLARWRNRPAWTVSLQNGIGNVELLSSMLGGERVLGGRVIFGATIEQPGTAHVTVSAAPVAIGPLDDASSAQHAAAGQFARVLTESGVVAEAVPDIAPVLWEKLLYNCGLNPLGAIHGLTYGEVARSPELRVTLDAAMDEGFRVARASGVALPWSDAAAYRAHFHARLLPPTAAHRSSMRQDLEAGRRTEVEAINGAIVRAGARAGVPTPVHSRLVAAVHEAERDSRAKGRGGTFAPRPGR